MTVFLESSVVPTKDTKLTLGKAIQVPPIGKSFIILYIHGPYCFS
jgi:hypothetical protein